VGAKSGGKKQALGQVGGSGGLAPGRGVSLGATSLSVAGPPAPPLLFNSQIFGRLPSKEIRVAPSAVVIEPRICVSSSPQMLSRTLEKHHQLPSSIGLPDENKRLGVL